ncbi:MAG: hypothetical protein ABW321_04235 [Polyangiales bacterium]
MHYLNATDQVHEDDAGSEICISSKPRPIEPAAHWVGTTALDLPAHQKTDVDMTCTPSAMAESAHIMAITPHMHRKGRRSKAVITRRTGEQVTLIDQAYELTEQRLAASTTCRRWVTCSGCRKTRFASCREPQVTGLPGDLRTSVTDVTLGPPS